MKDPWNELDKAAEKNLTPAGVAKFFRYKDQLQKDGHQWEDDAQDILSGFIWDASEDAD